MTLRNSNIVEGFPPSEDPGNSHLSHGQARELDKRAQQIDRVLGQAAHNGVQGELLEYVSGEVERLNQLYIDPES
jgi:hypothetical protein